MLPQSVPESIHMDMGNPFETYGIYCVGKTTGHLEWCRKLNFCLLAVLGRVFAKFCAAFVNFGATRVSKMTSPFALKSTQESTKHREATQLHRRGAKMVTPTAPAHENDTKRHKKNEAEYPPIPTTTALARPPRTKNSYMHPNFLNMAALAADWQLHRSVSKYCRWCFPIADEQHQNDTKRNPNTQMFTQSVASITSRMSRRVAMSCFVLQSTNRVWTRI